MNMYAAAPAAKTRLAPICIEAAPLFELVEVLVAAEPVAEAKPDCADSSAPEEVEVAAVAVADPVACVEVELPYADAAMQF